ncbi:MAG: ABC transporter permease [Clostridiales Family XIII bacterium]|jgi:ribose transport system permease protein|nr:ABC transporter permease [Clostridiales Family XIII bacterium]
MGVQSDKGINEINEINNRRIGNIFKSDTLVMLIVLIAVIAAFSVMNGDFLSVNNLMNILYASVIIGLLSIGQTYLIIAGHIDLSCGYIVALTGVTMAVLMRDMSIPWPLAFLMAFGVALCVGLANAALANLFDLQPFIATLAMGSVCHGAAYLLSDGIAVPISDSSFTAIATIALGKIPLAVIILIVLFVVFGFILARTVFGRSIYMIGGNVVAARLAGIKPKKVSTILYLISAGIAAVAGMLYAARMYSALPGAGGGAEFDAITAVVLGGVAFIGGRGNLAGCFIGLIIIQCFANGLTVMSVPAFWQVVAKGMLLIVALIFDYLRRRRLAV